MSNSRRDRWLVINYGATIFVSAFLLFQVQPLVSKHILPWFGGSPTVWTTCLLFFQTLLLAGYTYAHLSQRLKPAVQLLAQLVIIVAAVALLGVLPGKRWQPQEGGSPIGQILLILTASIGLPFFALSTTAPLVQSWFARSFPGRVPYRLYALSNLGSLLALLSYPLVFERWLDLPHQARLWSVGFVAYAVLCGIAGVWLWRRDARRGVSTESDGEGRRSQTGTDEISDTVHGNRELRLESPTWRQRVLWLLLPAFATVGLLATTNHVCANVAVVPFLWVVPLALYLLTFIIAFDHTRWYRRFPLAIFTFATIYAAVLVNFKGVGWIKLFNCGTTGRLAKMVVERFAAMPADFGAEAASAVQSPRFYVGFLTFLALNFAAMFGICMLCHGELVRQRPHPRHLTAFYLMIAAGGVLGGALVTLVAPHVFHTYFEWQLFMLIGWIGAIALIVCRLIRAALPDETAATAPRRSGLIPLVTLAVMLVPTSLALLDVVEFLQVVDEGVVMRERNFFGTLSVRKERRR